MTNLSNHSRFHKEPRQKAGKKDTEEEILSVMEDLVFKEMLTMDTEDSREALRSLLSACTRWPVSSVQVIKNELIPEHQDAKQAHVDVHVTFNDGENADLEMQVSKTDDDIKTRAQVYAAMLLSGQSRKGRKYNEIKRIYQIFFLNCIIFPNSGKMPQRFSYREETEHHRLNDMSEIIFYEMPRLEQKVRDMIKKPDKIKTSDLSEEEKWCIFMRYRHEKRAARLVAKLYQEEEGIMRAEKAVNGISRDYLKFAREMNMTKSRWDHEQRLDKAEKEGHAKGMAQGLSQGLEKGLSQGKLEVAQKMKARGRPLEEIVEDTGLSLETIKQMKKT